MSLNPLNPALRTLHYDAVSPAKVNLVVQPGAELAVPADVAEQLEAASPQFKSKPKKAPAKKAPAKKSAAKPKG